MIFYHQISVDVGWASRYPCGSLHVDGIWFYGTYALDNENHEPGFGKQMNSSRAGHFVKK